MKKIILAGFGVLLLTMYSCEKDDEVVTLPVVTEAKLTAQEESDLIFLREEEKLARDVYLYAYNKYGTEIFTKISNSEQSHMSQVLTLLDSFNIEDPASQDTGVFNNTVLQGLYDDLTTIVDSSLVHALTVGATIEDLDIEDIESFITNTEVPEILHMYDVLVCGSRNHIRGYTDQLSNEGVTYVPQFLPQANYDDILAGSHEMCN